MEKPLLTFYGDDFTGATDAMDALSRKGLRTVLLLEKEELQTLEEDFGKLDAIGIAGMSRSLPTNELENELFPAFEFLNEINAPVTHYKVCSTFDSSPEIGSIGRAIDIGQTVFQSSFVPLAVGVPQLQRYVAFSTLFAKDNSKIHRIDKHPTMSEHPVTPMTESDLRNHLSKQTDRNISRMNLLQLKGEPSDIDEAFQSVRDSETDIVLFDTVTKSDMQSVGRLIWESSKKEQGSLFVVGSSGVEYALSNHWQQSEFVDTERISKPSKVVDQLLVISGSASPMTKRQIEWAVENGFRAFQIDAPNLIDPKYAEQTRKTTAEKALELLSTGDSVILYTAFGPSDSSITKTKQRFDKIDAVHDSLGQAIGVQQGRIVREMLNKTELERICIAGGDTCGYTMSELDVYALESKAPIAYGAPLCQVQSYSPDFRGIEVALKGGQLGQVDYFGRVQNAKSNQ